MVSSSEFELRLELCVGGVAVPVRLESRRGTPAHSNQPLFPTGTVVLELTQVVALGTERGVLPPVPVAHGAVRTGSIGPRAADERELD